MLSQDIQVKFTQLNLVMTQLEWFDFHFHFFFLMK